MPTKKKSDTNFFSGLNFTPTTVGLRYGLMQQGMLNTFESLPLSLKEEVIKLVDYNLRLRSAKEKLVRKVVPVGDRTIEVQEIHLIDENGNDLGVKDKTDLEQVIDYASSHPMSTNTNELDNLVFDALSLGAGFVNGAVKESATLLGKGINWLADKAAGTKVGQKMIEWLPKLSFSQGLGTYGSVGRTIGGVLDASLAGLGAYGAINDVANNGFNLENGANLALAFSPIFNDVYNTVRPVFNNPLFRYPFKRIIPVTHVTSEGSGLRSLSELREASSSNIGGYVTNSDGAKTIGESLALDNPIPVTGKIVMPRRTPQAPDLGNIDVRILSTRLPASELARYVNPADTNTLNMLNKAGIKYKLTPNADGLHMLEILEDGMINPREMFWPNMTAELARKADNLVSRMEALERDNFGVVDKLAAEQLNSEAAEFLQENGKFPFRVFNEAEGVETIAIHPDNVVTEGTLPEIENIYASNPVVTLTNSDGLINIPIVLEGTTYPMSINSPKPWEVASLPGLQIKPLMRGSVLEKSVGKNGQISVNAIQQQMPKFGKLDLEIMNQVLATHFNGQKKIDYNEFRRLVLESIPQYRASPPGLIENTYADYGLNRLGISQTGNSFEWEVNPQTLVFHSNNLPTNNDHFMDATGHIRYYTDPQEPDVFTLVESLSDAAQKNNFDKLRLQLSDLDYKEKILRRIHYKLKSIIDWERNLRVPGRSSLEISFIKESIQDDKNKLADLLKAYKTLETTPAHFDKLHDNYLQRQLYESMKIANQEGKTVLRYPTSETAAKIEGFEKRQNTSYAQQYKDKMNKLAEDFENGLFDYNMYDTKQKEVMNWWKTLPKEEYAPEHQTILKKYSDFPKMYEKMFGRGSVRTVNDRFGNSWYEVDIPLNFNEMEWKYKTGGKLIPRKNGRFRN